ncbi:glycosyltransferase family 76 protein [Teratosphaeria destructans]|uniref:GPI mannosyltransferase 2 n=1 Tax=Teratosphaeria destructans TaxID=418781 RepID=A0A9W7VYW8_9PEZI|nr:glycosyltransferase family 76 protein [Teratosphaeria destructans]
MHLPRLFATWKLLVLLLALLAPGPGYDSSTDLLPLAQHHHGRGWIDHAVQRLTRWDAVYFATTAARGHRYEQEWAFSWLWSRVTSYIARVLPLPLSLHPITRHALAAILLAHLTHYLAVRLLYHLVDTLVPTDLIKKRHLAFTTAALHILSPAGIFLSAPYAEAPFALANFLGTYCYVRAVHHRLHPDAHAHAPRDAAWTLAAGLSFGLAATLRSNGLLSALPFVWDLLATLPRLPHILRTRDRASLTRLAATLLATLLLVLAFAGPQLIAYLHYCRRDHPRPWCAARPPSIYTFVQSHYWHVGPFRYWTLSNLPLFALAFPLGWIIVETAIPCLLQPHHLNRVLHGSTAADQTPQPYPPVPHTREERVFEYVLPRIALPQLVLVVMAATSFHVQILNRIASGYPLWYLILAVEICASGWDERAVEAGRTQAVLRLFGHYDRLPRVTPEWVVRGMVIYAVVQAGLYASFMPPA